MKLIKIGEAAFNKAAFFMVFILLWANVKSDTIKNYVEVKNDKVYLSDILVTNNEKTIEKSKTIEIMISPRPGEQKIIEGRYVKMKLKQSKITSDNIEIPEKIIIKREKFNDLSGEIKRKINEKLEEIYNNKEMSYEFKSSDDAIEIPEGEYEISITDKKILEGVAGKFYSYVEIVYNEKVYKKINIYLIAGKKNRAYILTENVYRGENFSYLKLELKDIIEENSEELITKENSINFENKVYKGVLKKGEIIKPKDFTAIRVFKRNSKVKIVIEYDGVNINYIGRAMEDGYLGESVKVLNEKSKKIITGIVQENGSIKINMENN
jgi:flagellar basal body P-ring formation protein FlgA